MRIHWVTKEQLALALQDAQEAKEEGMERAEEHANVEWKEVAFRAVLEAARLYEDFTSDDVMDLIPEGAWTHEKRALGPVMLRAAKAGFIVKTGTVRNSKRRSLHASPRQVWRGTVRSGRVLD